MSDLIPWADATSDICCCGCPDPPIFDAFGYRQEDCNIINSIKQEDWIHMTEDDGITIGLSWGSIGTSFSSQGTIGGQVVIWRGELEPYCYQVYPFTVGVPITTANLYIGLKYGPFGDCNNGCLFSGSTAKIPNAVHRTPMPEAEIISSGAQLYAHFGRSETELFTGDTESRWMHYTGWAKGNCADRNYCPLYMRFNFKDFVMWVFHKPGVTQYGTSAITVHNSTVPVSFVGDNNSTGFGFGFIGGAFQNVDMYFEWINLPQGMTSISMPYLRMWFNTKTGNSGMGSGTNGIPPQPPTYFWEREITTQKLEIPYP